MSGMLRLNPPRVQVGLVSRSWEPFLIRSQVQRNQKEQLGKTAGCAWSCAGSIAIAPAICLARSVRRNRLARNICAAGTCRSQFRGASSLGAARRSLSSVKLGRRPVPDETGLPPMSADGGGEDEFQEYWEWFQKPQSWPEGWIERRTHPQVGVRPYWYNTGTRQTVFEPPACLENQSSEPIQRREEPLEIEGAVADLSVKELRQKLQDPEEIERLALTDDALACRAVWEYETFIPRVLSWHDYQYNTFWFFIDDRDEKGKRGGRGQGFFGAEADKNKKMFAHHGFFEAVAEVASQRLEKIHPINLVYLLWTFTRAGVRAQRFFNQAADHFCNGLLPSLDRCGLGTLVWCYAKQRFRHHRLFDEAAKELQRAVRVRSLAPRNFQNTMIAFRWYGMGRASQRSLIDMLAAWLPRMLDDHDERRPKLRPDVMFSYTCKDGSVVPADSFRISGLNVIARGFVHLDASSEPVEACLASMTDYVLRSARRSPTWMRTDGDVAVFTTVVAEAVVKGWPSAPGLLSELEAELPLVRRGARQRELEP
ncbi:unnamed protein product [Symbiodinium natans]|uniref:WW domain-containing protein n=1 Tax=Symbiodinium natans TaxID=878477 RepID=A0A812IHP9_9DINO|nr:unnamed protein product [Symbiodinium natans]